MNDLICRDDSRRRELFAQRDRFNGIDFVEVLDGAVLCVHFFGEVPEVQDDEHPDGLRPADVVVSGGRRIRDLRVLALRVEHSADPDRDDCLRVTLDRIGDFSTYELRLIDVAGFDPRYCGVDFRFRLDCPTELDCAPPTDCASVSGPAVEVNYLAKDYASFRQLILDRMAFTVPDWAERHEADVGIALFELLAYAGDHLSYYQDAVATEAYLASARQRISVRRHARLVDYAMHEGLNARAWVTVWTDVDTPPVRAGDLSFITLPSSLSPSAARVVRSEDLESLSPNSYLVYEPVVDDRDQQLVFRASRSEIAFHTWGDDGCCLATGATEATLRETDPPLDFQPGDVLVLEEVKGVDSGQPADADPTHRHVVRLTTATASMDELLGVAVVEVEWAAEDYLPFSLCLSTRLPAPDCRRIDDISVARGNVVLVDHGRTVEEPLGAVGEPTLSGDCACEGSVLELHEQPPTFAAVLARTDLTFADQVDLTAAAAEAGRRDPRSGLPRVCLASTVGAPPAPLPDPLPRPARWEPRPDLLGSSAADRHFVVEVDDEGYAHLRFGDGELGARPPALADFEATYRTGNGRVGNVGREAISHLVLRSQQWSGVDARPRNPFEARGGVDPEPTAEVKVFAPDAFRAVLRRAITADDYASLAAARRGVQAAAAELAWTGSWYEARVAVDALGRGVAGDQLLTDIEAHLQAVRRMGHDLDVVAARPVPIDLQLHVCVDAHHSRGVVSAAVREVLGSGRTADGRLAMFNPDNLTFGTSVRLSRIVAAVQSLEGVSSVEVTRLRRLDHPDAGELETGLLAVRDLEIARLSGDPSIPEDGRLVLVMGGGR